MRKNKTQNVEEQRYRVLIDHAPEAVVILDAATGRFIDFNENALKLFGLPGETLVTMGPVDLSPATVGDRDASDYSLELVREALRGGNPVFDWIHTDSEGREIPCEIRLVRFPPYDRQLVRASIIDVSERRRMEQALEESEERLQLAMSATGLGIFDWHFREKQWLWDERMHQLFGLPPGSDQDKQAYFLAILHPDDRDRISGNLERMMIFQWDAPLFEDEFRILINGDLRFIKSSGLVFHDESGTLRRIVGACRDVTEARRREALLRKTTERLEEAQRIAKLGNFETDLTTRTTWWSEGMYQIFERTPEELTPNLETFMKYVYPHDRESIRRQIGVCIQTGADQRLSYRLQLPDGRIKYMDDIIRAVQNGEDRITGLIGTSQDITRIRQTEAELQRALKRLQLVIDTARLGIWEWDIQTDTLVWDDTMFALYNVDESTFTGDSSAWQSRLHPDDRPALRQAMIEALKGEKEFDTAFRVLWPDQSVRYIKVLATVQRDEQGRAVWMLGANWDITKEKEAEQQRLRARQLELKNKELEQFAYVASHDLQEPLRTVIGFVELLRRNYQEQLDDKAGQHLQFISQAATRMSRLISGLLEYARIGQKRELTTVDCHSLVGNILDDLGASIAETKAVIEVEPLPPLQGYETELRVLFQNLLSNALKFRRKDAPPRIRIAAEENQHCWTFRVADNGIGIDPRYQEKIFVIFQRLHPHNEYEGTGIGLAHCQKITDLHGGRIWVDSVPGRGSTFYFTIPQ